MRAAALAASAAIFCLAAAAQIEFGRLIFFPNLPLIFVIFRSMTAGGRAVAAACALGVAMDILSFGWVGPHAFSLIVVCGVAAKGARTFELPSLRVFAAFVFVCSHLAFAAVVISHGIFSQNPFDVPVLTALAQSVSNTAAATVIFHLLRAWGKQGARA